MTAGFLAVFGNSMDTKGGIFGNIVDQILIRGGDHVVQSIGWDIDHFTRLRDFFLIFDSGFYTSF